MEQAPMPVEQHNDHEYHLADVHDHAHKAESGGHFEHSEHVCSSDCQHAQAEADQRASELFSDLDAFSYQAEHAGGHVCDAHCEHTQSAADSLAESLFATAPPESDHPHSHEKYHCKADCAHTTAEADDLATTLFVELPISKNEKENQAKNGDDRLHVHHPNCVHDQSAADRVADELFVEATQITLREAAQRQVEHYQTVTKQTLPETDQPPTLDSVMPAVQLKKTAVVLDVPSYERVMEPHRQPETQPDTIAHIPLHIPVAVAETLTVPVDASEKSKLPDNNDTGLVITASCDVLAAAVETLEATSLAYSDDLPVLELLDLAGPPLQSDEIMDIPEVVQESAVQATASARPIRDDDIPLRHYELPSDQMTEYATVPALGSAPLAIEVMAGQTLVLDEAQAVSLERACAQIEGLYTSRQADNLSLALNDIEPILQDIATLLAIPLEQIRQALVIGSADTLVAAESLEVIMQWQQLIRSERSKETLRLSAVTPINDDITIHSSHWSRRLGAAIMNLLIGDGSIKLLRLT